MLPNVPNDKGYGYNYFTTFGGINAQKGAKDGEISDMLNMTSDNYPVLSSRPTREYLSDYDNNLGFICYGDIIAYIEEGADKDIFHYGYNTKDLEKGGQREMLAMSNRILIFPDKKIYNVANNTLTAMEGSIENITVSLPRYGELYGAKAENNTIVASDVDFTQVFSVGDAVTLSGFTDAANNKTSIIRELTATEMRFYEFAFTLGVSNYTYTLNGVLAPGYYTLRRRDDYVRFQVTENIPANTVLTCSTGATPTITASPATTAITNVAVGKQSSDTALTFSEIPADLTGQTISISRTIPEMDFYFVSNNRLWGCKGDSIYCSKLGDPTNFNVFDGLATDSWSVDTGTPRAFTGACEYLGYPTFFKEHGIFKVYGDYPSQYSLSKNMFTGVKEGCGKTLAVAGNVLFYVSEQGVMAYTGGVPRNISKPLNVQIDSGVAGSDDEKYYLSANGVIYIFDTNVNAWWKEDGVVLNVSFGDKLFANMQVEDEVKIYALNNLPEAESEVEWVVTFADMLSNTPNNKEIYKVEIMSDTSLTDEMPIVEYTNDGENWILWGTMTKDIKHSDTFAIRPDRRKYFAMRISGTGLVDIYNIAIFKKENIN